MTQYLTFSPQNQLSFVCPIFNVSTKMAACLKLRELVWRGKTPDVRKGCQACMKSSKCPAAAIVQKISYTKAPDAYGSLTPVEARLDDAILGRILPVVVQEAHLNLCDVPAAERALIETANARIEKQMVSAPKQPIAARRRAVAKVDTPKAAPAPSVPNAIQDAAASGDLAAAIN